MKVVYDARYEQVYSHDPAARAGRMEAIIQEVSPHFEVVTAEAARPDEIRLAHSEEHINDIRRMGQVFEVALLAAGGAVKAAQLAAGGEAAFGLVRPPGHHASRNHCWGFCFFNNMAISIARLRKDNLIKSALILDIDLHFGDGTANIFHNTPEVAYLHPEGLDRQAFLDSIPQLLGDRGADVVAVSAGFDRHEHDWGRLLKTEDYETVGRIVKEFARKRCRGRRYGVLEGGYNHEVLGKNVRALLAGMS